MSSNCSNVRDRVNGGEAVSGTGIVLPQPGDCCLPSNLASSTKRLATEFK
jgi:hypothetical protein